MTKAVLYLRVSTDAQRKRDLPIRGQRAACRAYAKQRGYKVVGEYSDAITGQTDEREGFQRMVADAASGAWTVVIVWEYSRFARKLWHQERYIEMLEKLGVAVESTVEGSSSWERVIKGKASQDEAQMISERTMRGKRTAVKQGQWPSGRPPYGLRKDPERRTLVVIDEEARVLRLAMEMLRGGMAMIRVAEELTRLGYRTRSGAVWHYGSLRNAMFAPAVFGEVALRCHSADGYKLLRYEGAHEAILDRAELEAMGYSLGRSICRRQAPMAPMRYRRAPLSGLCRCLCGGTMTFWRDNRYRDLTYYVCQARVVPEAEAGEGARAHRCARLPYVRTDAVEPEVWRQVWAEILEPSALRSLAERLVSSSTAEQSELSAALTEARSHLRSLERQTANVVESLRQAGPSPSLLSSLSELESAAVEQRTRVGWIEAQLERLSAEIELPRNLEQVVSRTRSVVEELDSQAQNRFLRGLLSGVEIRSRQEFRAIPHPGIPRLTAP